MTFKAHLDNPGQLRTPLHRFQSLRHGPIFGGPHSAHYTSLASGGPALLALSVPPGGKLQKPQSEPSCVPGKHEAASHDGGLQVEHETDRPLGPGQPQGGQVVTRTGCSSGALLGSWRVRCCPAWV